MGLEPGVYEVRFEREPKALSARLEIREGPHQVLDLAGFGPARLEFTRLRGVDTGPEYVLNGRHMGSVMFGMWDGPGGARPVSGAPGALVVEYVNAGRLAVTTEYLKFVRDDLAVGAAVHVLVDSVESTSTGDTVAVRDRAGVNLPVVIRWNPIRRFTSWRSVEPYVRGTFGPLVGTYNAVRTVGKTVASETIVNTTIGGSAGMGADVRVGQSWASGVSVSYNVSGDVQEVGVDRIRYSGWEVTFGVARLFGTSKPRRR
jgi:hypothetical protein